MGFAAAGDAVEMDSGPAIELASCPLGETDGSHSSDAQSADGGVDCPTHDLVPRDSVEAAGALEAGMTRDLALCAAAVIRRIRLVDATQRAAHRLDAPGEGIVAEASEVRDLIELVEEGDPLPAATPRVAALLESGIVNLSADAEKSK